MNAWNFFCKASPRRHHFSFRSMARYQPSNVNCLLGLPDDSLESFLGEEWEEMMVDKNNHKHLKHHQASVCGVNNRGRSQGFSQAGQGSIHPSSTSGYQTLTWSESQTNVGSMKLNSPAPQQSATSVICAHSCKLWRKHTCEQWLLNIIQLIIPSCVFLNFYQELSHTLSHLRITSTRREGELYRWRKRLRENPWLT